MARRLRRRTGSQSGQATIEFALVLMLLMAFILFFMQLSLVFAWGNYVHYATFMSARAYLSAGPNQDDQKDRAQQVIIRMLKKSSVAPGIDRFPMIAKGEGGDGDIKGLKLEPPSQFQKSDRYFSWMEGVRYTFRSRLFLIPMGKAGSSDKNANSLTLTSESWLGREPSELDCQKEIEAKQGAIIDNGC